MSTSVTEVAGWAAIDRLAETMAKVRPATKAPAMARESDGSVQLVGYPGWRLIIERIEKKKGAA